MGSAEQCEGDFLEKGLWSMQEKVIDGDNDTERLADCRLRSCRRCICGVHGWNAVKVLLVAQTLREGLTTWTPYRAEKYSLTPE